MFPLSGNTVTYIIYFIWRAWLSAQKTEKQISNFVFPALSTHGVNFHFDRNILNS